MHKFKFVSNPGHGRQTRTYFSMIKTAKNNKKKPQKLEKQIFEVDFGVIVVSKSYLE